MAELAYYGWFADPGMRALAARAKAERETKKQADDQGDDDPDDGAAGALVPVA